MSWAGGRRLVILLIVGAVVIAFLTILSFSVFYKAPSCSDGVANQGEAGIDCGGPCAYLCTDQEQAPTVLFTKAVSNGQGRLDVIAEVENKNVDAGAKNVTYHITLYGQGQILLGESTGTVDLPPNAIVPVFVPGLASAKQMVTGAFLEIDSHSFRWVSLPTDPRIVPSISAPQIIGTVSNPRVQATLTNTSATPLTNIHVIAFVRNSQGEVIAASATLVGTLPAQGQATALFTWNAPFSGVPNLIEVAPVVPLP